MIGKIKYVGKSFGLEGLTDGTVYECISIEPPFVRVIDDSGEDYLYTINKPSSLDDPTLYGKWVIVEDKESKLKEIFKDAN